MEKEYIKELLVMAAEAAKTAVQIISSQPEEYRKVDTVLERDLKIKADCAIENIICEQLKKATSFPIIAEESDNTTQEIAVSDLVWIIDPLDGSVNFSRGIPIFSVSIALWRGKNPVGGVIYDFSREELFVGVVGLGAWLNGEAISVGSIARTKNALLCTGFPVGTDFSLKALNEFSSNIKRFKKVRLLGSAALSLAYVACNRADAYWEKGIKIWDVAAGIAIVIAAGGAVNYSETGDLLQYNVIAGNCQLVEEVTSSLAI